jgi:SAM-dependent methyltransferase
MTHAIETRGNLSQRWFARVWAIAGDSFNVPLEPARDAVLTDIPKRLVEIGPGYGASFSHYPEATEVVAFEPNPEMHNGLRAAAIKHGINLDLRTGKAEAIDLPDNSVDLVVSGMVLCSVSDQDKALAEIRRVLRPGGRLAFIEHIAAPDGTWRARVQAALRHPWSWVADGCDVRSHSAPAIYRAGFSNITGETRIMGSSLDPSALMFYGVATN